MVALTGYVLWLLEATAQLADEINPAIAKGARARRDELMDSYRSQMGRNSSKRSCECGTCRICKSRVKQRERYRNEKSVVARALNVTDSDLDRICLEKLKQEGFR